MFLRVAIFLFALLTICTASLSAQPEPFTYQDVCVLEEYTNPQVLSLYQDCRGLLWISTYGGIDRWDGNRMVHYPYMPFESSGSPDRIPWGFTGDNQNNIWICFLDEGLMRFDLETKSFHRIPLNYNGSELDIRYIKFDPKGFLWVGSMEGIFKFYPDIDSLSQIPIFCDDKIEEAYFRKISILQDSTGNVWMSHNQYGLCWFDSAKEAFTIEPLDLPEFVDKHMNVGLMKEDPYGNFWLFGRKAELAMFNPYTREFLWSDLPVYGSIAPSSWGGLAIDDQGKIWFGTDRGLMRYNPVTKTLTRLDTPKALSYVTDMITDNHGNIIVGTMEGVKVIDPREKAIHSIDVHLETLVEGAGWHTCIVRDDQILWMGTFKAGLIRYNLETEKFVNYQADGKGGSINSNYVTKTLRDRNGRIWFTAGFDGSLYRVNPDKESFEHFHVGNSHYITEGNEGFFWVLGRDHMVKFDPITLDTTRIYFKKPLPVEQLQSQLDFVPFIRDNEGIFWFAQQDRGLFRIDLENGEWTHYNYNKNNPSGLPDRHVKSLFNDSRGNIWLSTWVGLSRVIKNADNDPVITFDNHYIMDLKKKGHTSRIAEDDFGNLFVGNLYGILVIRPDGTMDSYSEQDGLLKAPSTWMVESDHENGDIYLGGQKLMILHPGFLSPDTSTMPIILTDLRIGGKSLAPGEASPLKSSIVLADLIDLRHNQNFFRIDFATLNFNHPERNRYRYFLEGVDNDTIYSGNKSFAEYTDLSPGNYTFWVSGASHRGPWNKDGTTLEIRIHPPWYLTQLALAIYFILIITLILAFIRLRTSRLLMEKLQLEVEVGDRLEEITQMNRQILDLDLLKTRFFNNISHEFRTLVTMIKAPTETIIEEERVSSKAMRGLEVIYRNANRLMELVSQLLDISRIDRKSMKLSLSEENIFDFAQNIAVSFAALAEVRGIQYRYHISKTANRQWIDTDKLEKIINNLLSNAFKFSDEGGKIRMKVFHKHQINELGNVLEISVSDTGKGIPEVEQKKIFDRFYQAEASLRKEGGGTGIGLALASDLVELMHGTILLNSIPGEGSTFTVEIPLGLDHLDEYEYSICEQKRGKSQASISLSSLKHRKKTTGETGKEEEKPYLLLVEDNADILWMLTSKMGSVFNVLEAVDGSAGLKLAIRHMPDLIITDLMMPRMDGFELCRKLKTDIQTSHIPIIMLTAKANMEDKMLGLETGADDYITKPFEVQEVMARSKNLVTQRRKLREKFSKEITLHPRDIVVTSTDEKFLTRIMDVIENHMSNNEFDVKELSEAMHMSRSTLYRKLEALTNQSPIEFIRTLRLKRAAILLKEQYGNVSEVALEVGFNNPSYFTRVFRKSYKVSPSEFAKS